MKNIFEIILNTLNKYIAKDSDSIFIIVIKIVLLIAGTVATGAVALKLLLILWGYIADGLILILGIVFVICGLWGADISGYFQDQRIKKNTAQADLDISIVWAVFDAVCVGADYFRFSKPTHPDDLQPQQNGSRWYFSLYLPSAVSNNISNSLYDMYILIQRHLDDIRPYNGKYAVVEAINLNPKRGDALIIVKKVDEAEYNAIVNRWYTTSKNTYGDPDPSDFDDDDF